MDGNGCLWRGFIMKIQFGARERMTFYHANGAEMKRVDWQKKTVLAELALSELYAKDVFQECGAMNIPKSVVDVIDKHAEAGKKAPEKEIQAAYDKFDTD